MPNYHDPWARHNAWRYHDIFKLRNQVKSVFPGLGIATVAFTAYCIVDHFFFDKHHGDHHGRGHGNGHGDGHH